MTGVDAVSLNFSKGGLLVINIAIAFMMLGVALDLKIDDFKRIIVSPRAPAIGLASQFILLPAFTFLLTLIMKPFILSPSIALGMIMVAACPGGNLSNIITYLARGNTALSISMTAVSSIAAILMTPLNLEIWGSLNSTTYPILQKVHLDPLNVFVTIFIILGIPMSIGMILGNKFPNLADRVRKPFKIFSFAFFISIVIGALGANWNHFLNYVGVVIFAVVIHNALALTLGFMSGKLFSLPEKDIRAVSIEVGIQNSALGLVLFFNFFDNGNLGGMAVLIAFWGVWHIISGLTVAFIFSRRREWTFDEKF